MGPRGRSRPRPGHRRGGGKESGSLGASEASMPMVRPGRGSSEQTEVTERARRASHRQAKEACGAWGHAKAASVPSRRAHLGGADDVGVLQAVGEDDGQLRGKG